jgi:colanic acid/amylovoran biosynthesis glycosyltransferase
MDKGDTFSLLIAGINWPLETFLQRLVRGLLDAGFEITLATPRPPEDQWLAQPRIHWLHAPRWQGNRLVSLSFLAWHGLRASLTAPQDVKTVAANLRSPKILPRGSRYEHNKGGHCERSEGGHCERSEGGHCERSEAVSELTEMASPPARNDNFILDDEHWRSGVTRKTLRRELVTWHRLLPYLGRRWDAIYFPWNSGAIEHLPFFDLGMPVVISCRGSQVNTAPHNPKRAALQAGLLSTFEKAARVHCVSEHIRQEALRSGLSPEKACVIHPAVDPELFCPLEGTRPADNVYRIISVGALTWQKGYEHALQAAFILKEKNVPFRYEIIGAGPEQQRVLFTINDLGLQEHVHLLGRQPPEVVRQRLQPADVFLLSSLSEGLANTALEAMACALPVVTTDCGGMREAVTDGVEGTVVPTRDPAALAEALLAFWRHPQLRKQCGEAGRKRVIADFHLNSQVGQFSALFADLQTFYKNG